jgi:eukaryotic-like serine/threonine-protein kinase
MDELRAASGSVGRWSRLLGLGSLPGDQEESRAFLQRRVSLFYGAMAAIGWVFFLLSVIMMLRFMPDRLGTTWLLHPGRLFHLVSASFCSAAWLATRRTERTVPALATIDLVGSAVLVISTTNMLLSFPAGTRPEIEFLLILNMTLVARAAIIPSTPLRSLLVGVVGAISITAAATWLHMKAGVDMNQLAAQLREQNDVTMVRPPPRVIGVICFAWSSVSVALTVLISHVIYGLRRKVAEASQVGQYRLDEKIGEGGMGMVYRASHAMLRRPTAIKLLSPGRSGEQAVTRFEREVQTTATLTHPNTVAIYDYGRTPEGVFYYAMEYLDGVDLEGLVALNGPQPAARVVHILTQIAGALGEAHRAGLIHRDIKPANVILCERGGVADFVKVVDFGLVKEVAAGGALGTTQSNTINGTPLYMSPESILTPESIDARSDLYALGAVGYFLLTGKPVFEALSIVEVCAQHLHAEVIAPSRRSKLAVPPDLEALILSCLAKDAAERPASAAKLLRALSLLEIEEWTEDEATAWWSEHREKVRARRNETVSTMGTTVGVDLQGRAA